MSTLFSIFSSPFGLPISPWWEWLILLMAGEVVHRIAWAISPGGRFGAIIYWPTKFLSFIVVWAMICGIIQGGQFILSHWTWFVSGLAVLLVVISAWLLAHKFGSGRNGKDER